MALVDICFLYIGKWLELANLYWVRLRTSEHIYVLHLYFRAMIDRNIKSLRCMRGLNRCNWWCCREGRVFRALYSMEYYWPYPWQWTAVRRLWLNEIFHPTSAGYDETICIKKFWWSKISWVLLLVLSIWKFESLLPFNKAFWKQAGGNGNGKFKEGVKRI